MTQKLPPDDKTEVLEVIAEYGILGNNVEAAFADLVQLAAKLCATPVAMIELKDQGGRWFKSKSGISAILIPTDFVFSRETLQQSELLVVNDALADPRFASDPVVTKEPFIQFYAGMPLITLAGFAVGTLSVMDHVPRNLSAEQIADLKALARQAVIQIELQRNLKLLEQRLTSQKQAEDALQRSMATNRALLNAIPDVMFRINRRGVVVNYRASRDEELFVAPADFMNRKVEEVLPPEVALSIHECINLALQTNHIQIREYQLPVKGKLRYFEGRFVVSAPDEVMVIVRNITQRKLAEEEIRKTLEKEKELGELRSRFVTMTSHEFRTPLSTILSSAELLEHYSHRWTEAKKIQHLHRIQIAVRNMTNLLQDVLVIGKAEAGMLEFQPTPLDLLQFCSELVEELQLIHAATHTINFKVQGLPDNLDFIQLDEKLLRHILSNLITNAIKYSPQSRNVWFDLSFRPGEILFQVRDEGIGISAADQAQLFNPFFRGNNVGNIAGTGLGLAIVKKSVDLHGGTISVESTIGAGTTFRVTIPLVRPGENNREDRQG